MSPVRREYVLYLEDMLQSMDRIEDLGDIDFNSFKQTSIVVDAIIKNLEIIGEASKNVPAEVQERYVRIDSVSLYN